MEISRNYAFVHSNGSLHIARADVVCCRQRRHFYYLTGCELPDCYFTYDVESGRSTLLIPPVAVEDVMWQGLPMAIEEAKGKYV